MEFQKITHLNLINKGEAFKKFFDFVRSHHFDNLPLGKIEIDGDDVFVMNVLTEGKSKEDQPLEMHRKFIDIHILLEGEESIGWKPTDEILSFTREYDADSDCALSEEPPRFFINLKPLEFCIAYPEDAHAPAIGKGRIRKLIGKIKV